MKITRAAMLVALAAAAVAVGPVSSGSADGRQLAGEFCTNPDAMPKPGACISLAYQGDSAQGYTGSSRRTLAVRPGTYWLDVNDTSTAHNFELESPDGSVEPLTAVADTPGVVTSKVHLTRGTWVLFCRPHRAMGMYVDLEVGGAQRQ